MAPIGNRYLQGQPVLPYTNYKALSGNDGFLDLQFVDHTQTPVTPTAISLEIDDITNTVDMLGPVTLSPTGATSGSLIYPAFTSSEWTLQIAASILTMTYPYVGSQLCQVKLSFQALDSVSGAPFNGVGLAIIELCSVASVTGF